MERERRGSQKFDHPNMCDLRIVLLGKNISENCNIRNLILGKDMRENEEPAALLRHNLKASGTVENRHVTVINTLHLLDPNISDHQITQAVSDCVKLSDPGPHVFILALQHNDFTEEDMRRVKHVLNKFSEEAINRSIVLTTDKEAQRSMIGSMFSRTEQLLGVSTVQTVHQMIKDCGGGHIQLDERKIELNSEIFKWIDKMLKGNQEDHLICELFHDFKGMSVDEDPISLEDENTSSHHSDFGNPKERQERRSEEGSVFHTRKQSPKLIRPNVSAKFSRKNHLNLVLCGSNGSFKVSVSKLLRGKKIKSLCRLANSEECVKKEGKIQGRLVSLVELPALNQLSEEEVMRQTLNCVSLCDPGVHVFLIIIPVGPLTDEDKAEMEQIKIIFNSFENFMLLFTSDLAVGAPVKNFIDSPECQRLISLCGGQYKLMGLKEPEESRQIRELLDYIENMKTEPYSLQMFVKSQETRVRNKLEERMREMESMIKDLQEKIQSESADSDEDDQECIRIVLIGKTGSGKSATGNTILGRNEFHSELRPDSVTSVCEKGVGEVAGRSVAVVDTPGLFDTTLKTDQVVEEIVKCVSMSSPGPHVFVIVLSLGRFTREAMDTMDLIKKIFGHKAAQFSIVLFTRGDDLENKSIEDYVSKYNSAELKKLIRDCGNRFLAFNNREKQDKTQVIHLINMIEEVKKMNHGRYFTNCMFEEAEMSIKKRTEEILKEREREIQAQNEKFKEKYEMEKKNLMQRLEEEKQRADDERIKVENQFREKEEKLRKEFEDKEKMDHKKQKIENQKQSEEKKQQREEYNRKIEEMKREIENQRSLYEKQQKEREAEDRKREEKYRQDQEKMKNEKENITAELQIKQAEEIKKRQSEEQMRTKQEEEERERWKSKIKEAENDRKEIQEEIKRQQKEWEDEKKQQTREREEEERKRKEKHEEQLREKQEELEKMRTRFEREREEERQKIEDERQKQKRENEEKEKEYKDKKIEMERHYERLERERKDEWERKKRDDDERREEERKRWKKLVEDLKQEQEEEIKRREKEDKERKEREEKERDKMKKEYEEKIKVIKNKHKDEARKQAEELNDFRERKEQHIQELQQMLEERQKQHELLEKLYQHLQEQKEGDIKKLLQEVEVLKNKTSCAIL